MSGMEWSRVERSGVVWNWISILLFGYLMTEWNIKCWISSHTLQIGGPKNEARWWNGFHNVLLHSTHFLRIQIPNNEVSLVTTPFHHIRYSINPNKALRCVCCSVSITTHMNTLNHLYFLKIWRVSPYVSVSGFYLVTMPVLYRYKQ